MYNYKFRQSHETLNGLFPAVSNICVPQSVDPICFLFRGQAHLGKFANDHDSAQL